MGKRREGEDVGRALGISAEMLYVFSCIAAEIKKRGGGPESIRLLEKDQELRGRVVDLIIEAENDNEEMRFFVPILKLDHAFNPAEFIGEGWTVWKGPKDGNGGNGEEEREKREDALIEVDFAKVSFYTQEIEVANEEENSEFMKMRGLLPLGGRTAVALWFDYQTNKKNSVLEYLYRTLNITMLKFMGVVLRSKYGNRSFVRLHRVCSEGVWHKDGLCFSGGCIPNSCIPTLNCF